MIKLKSCISERYGGAAKEISIWYHGTSMKRVPSILARGLDPNVPQKNKSWGSDTYTDASNLDKSSYGGIYVTRNLMTALSSASRTARQDKTNRSVVILQLQPRTLIADEDDIAIRIMHLNRNVAGSIFHSIYPYMWEVYGIPHYHREYADETKTKWVKEAMESLFHDLKIDDIRFKGEVQRLLYNEGYRAMLTRTVSYLDKAKSHSEYYEWRKAYADVNKLEDYGPEQDIPMPPHPKEGERIFRQFVDKLTRTMKHKARHLFTGSFCRTGRSLEPITFHGKNKIIAIVETLNSKTQQYHEDIKIIYGQLPSDFEEQWKDRVGELTIVT